MKKRGDACGCIQRFLTCYQTLKNGLRYEDDLCSVEYRNGVIRAYAYEVVNGTRYRVGDCIMTIW